MGEEANAHALRPRVAGSTTRGQPSVHSHVDPNARRRVCLPSSVSAPPSVSSGVSRLSPGSTSMRRPVRSCCSRAPTARARPRCCGCSPAWCRCTRARRWCSTTTSPSIASGARRDLALVGHETFCYDDLTVRENLRFAARAAGPGRRRRRRRARAARAHPAGRRRAPPPLDGAAPTPGGRGRAVARSAPAAARRAPRRSRRRRPGSSSTTSSRAAPSEARTVLIASHELDHARELATREVVITAGQAHLDPARSRRAAHDALAGGLRSSRGRTCGSRPARVSPCSRSSRSG